MLHYYGNIEAMPLGSVAKPYISLYEKDGNDTCYVPYIDMANGRKRYVKFVKMAGVEGWVFVGLEA